MSDRGEALIDRTKKRKKKRSQIQMAKKFARKRSHGSDLDAETYQYMVRILDLMRGDFSSEEERLIFVNNVYEETIGREVQYATNQVGSRVLDSLLQYASLEVIERLVDAFSESFRPLSSDKFASHVLQNILLVCADRGNQSEKSATSDAIKQSDVQAYNKIVIRLCKYFINNVEEFVFDTYANHLLRTVLECLGGLIDRPENDRKKDCVLRKRRSVGQEYKTLLVQTCNRMHKWPRFLEFGRDELTSGFVQSMLYSLKDIDTDAATMVVNKIVYESFQSGTTECLSNIFDNESSIRLLEACLATAQPEPFTKIHDKFFKGNLRKLSLIKVTNFSIQRLLDYCSDKEVFEEIFQEISVVISEVLEMGHTGILSSLANACLRLQTRQGAFVNDLLKTLRCETKEKQSEIVLCMSTLKNPDELERIRRESGPKFHINLHGSLTVQAVLNFNKPIKIVNSILAMNSEDLLRMFNDPKGSRIMDAFMDSKYVGEKSREKLVKKLKGCWAELAKSTHGSRCLERAWEWAQKNQRLVIMEELAATGESLRSTKSGSIISSKLNVPLFARKKNDWIESQGKEEKTRALFANIIGDAKKDRKS